MTIHNKRIKEGYMLSRIQKKYTIINSLHVYTHIYESNSQYNGTKTSIITETKIKYLWIHSPRGVSGAHKENFIIFLKDTKTDLKTIRKTTGERYTMFLKRLQFSLNSFRNLISITIF